MQQLEKPPSKAYEERDLVERLVKPGELSK